MTFKQMRRILDTVKNFRLVWRLFWDQRVPLILKLAIPMSLGYLALPFDLVKDFIPVVGRIEDFIIIAIASLIFVRLSPPAIVREHREAIWGSSLREGDKVTEGEYRILKDEDSEQGSARKGC